MDDICSVCELPNCRADLHEESAGLVERIIDAAQKHGEQSEPDHEVGDLQDVLRKCWEEMTVAQRQAVFAESKELIETWS